MRFLLVLAVSLFGGSLLIPTGAAAGDLRITSIDILDEGSSSEDAQGTASIDVSKGSCGVSPNTSEEPFHDSLVRFTLVNHGKLPIYLRSVSYTLKNPYGTGASVRTKRLAFSGSTLVEADKEKHSALSLFLDVDDSGKTYAGKSTAIPSDLGFRNVTFTVYAVTASGRKVQVKGRTALSFDDFDRC